MKRRSNNQPFVACRIVSAFAVVACLSLSCGCSYITPNPAAELRDRSVALPLTGQSADALDSTLGDPYLNSSTWGVQVYRESRSQTEIPIAGVVPYGRLQDELIRYTLVALDDNRKIDATASGILRRPPKWRMTQPIEMTDMALFLQAGNATLACGWEDRLETLLVSTAARDAFLSGERTGPDAIIVIGCGSHECAARLSIDEGPPLQLPYRLDRLRPPTETAVSPISTYNRNPPPADDSTATIQDTVAAVRLSPGQHTIRSWGGRWQHGKLAGLIGGSGSATFTCSPGQIIYLVIDVTVEEYTWWGLKGIRWDITSQNEMPDFFRPRPLIIYRDGKWLCK